MVVRVVDLVKVDAEEKVDVHRETAIARPEKVMATVPVTDLVGQPPKNKAESCKAISRMKSECPIGGQSGCRSGFFIGAA